MGIDPLDQTYIVPLHPRVIEAMLGDHQGDLPAYRIEAADDSVRVFDGDMLVLESIETLAAGTVVRLAPMMGDAFELAAFVGSRQKADTLIACELAADRMDTVLGETLGGMPASRSKGRWRPIDERHRAIWSAHAAAHNTAAMRMAAEASRKAA